jgi:catechol 2,3-dioxygenase-like lactoylglutathione lyase family enzyme
MIRIARPTRNLESMKRFYCEGLGLKVIGEFSDHAKYSGLMIGLPTWNVHLEFTTFDDPDEDQSAYVAIT